MDMEKEKVMQDLKTLGDKPELRLGNREVAFLVGTLFVVLVVVFGLGVMVGKRLYGQPPGVQMVASTQNAPKTGQTGAEVPRAPGSIQTEEQPEATGESYTFYKNLREGETEGSETTKPKPKTAEHETTETETTAEKPKTEAAAATTAKPKPITPKPAVGDWKWSIQVAAFLRKDNANKFRDKLRNKGLDAWVLKVEPKETGNVYYAIRLGKYKDYDKAKKHLEELKGAKLIPDDSYIRGR